jgi:flagellar hook-associated protein 2
MAITASSFTSALSAGTLTSTGLGSGIDVNGLVSKLMAVEQQPLVQLQTQEASYQAKISAYGSVQSVVAGFQSAVNALNSASTFSARTVTVGNTSVASASADGTVSPGSHSLSVSTLAQAQSLITTGTYASTSTQIGTGTLTIDFGTYGSGSFTQNAAEPTKTVTISASQGSLAGIRDAINSADVGVTASVINDGSGYRLMLTSSNSGTANAMRIGVTNTSGTLSDLAYDASGGTSNMSQTVAAQDAQFTLDGVSMTSASNTVSNAIAGLTLNLLGTNSGSSTTVTVNRSVSTIETAVTNLVSAYNSAAATIKSLTAYDTSTNTAQTLTGDFTTLSIQAQLRSIMTASTSLNAGGVTSLADLGVTFNKDGTVSLNSTTLHSELSDSTVDTSALFLALGQPTDSLISYAGSTSSTLPGTYAVDISQIATNGRASSSNALSLLTDLSAPGQNLTMTIDGVSATVSLASAQYTNAGLVAALQSAINGTSAFSNAGVAVTVGMNGTQATITGSQAAATTITAGVNNSIDVTIDGSGTQTVALTAGTYTASTLASMVQSQINAAFGGGTSVAVTQSNGTLVIKSNLYGATSGVTVADSTGTTGATSLFGSASRTATGTGTASLVITSNTYGSASGVDVTGGTAATTLFGAATLSGTAGVDVVGTIDGVAATGVGQTLTAASGNAKGLELKINGGITGSRGSVSFGRGIGDQLSTAIKSITDSSSGTIVTATNSIEKTIANLQAQQVAMASQLTVIQQRYLTQFNAMDNLIASLQTTSNYLTQTFNALNGTSSNTKIG